MKKIMKIAGGAFLLLAALVIALLLYLASRPTVPNGYGDRLESGGEIEKKYLAAGACDVSYFEQAVMENYEKYEVWYPTEMEAGSKRYPVVVINNGTGVKASQCEALWKHLASWGFIVIATEEEYSWNGFSAEMSLNYLLKANENEESIFYRHIDTEHIGISGHSQGGVGVISAVTSTEHQSMYRAAFAASVTHEALAYALEWEYDASQISVPFFMVAGTGDTDAQTISPLSGMTAIFDKITAPPIKVMARRTGADHGDMLTAANGYETAWFLWLLQGDEEAGKAFTGASPELLGNPLYQDQQISGSLAG